MLIDSTLFRSDDQHHADADIVDFPATHDRGPHSCLAQCGKVSQHAKLKLAQIDPFLCHVILYASKVAKEVFVNWSKSSLSPKVFGSYLVLQSQSPQVKRLARQLFNKLLEPNNVYGVSRYQGFLRESLSSLKDSY